MSSLFAPRITRKMSFRRFVNLVSTDSPKSVYALRRIDTSHLFLLPTISNEQGTIGGRSTTPMKDDCRPLPEPAINFYSSHLPGDCGEMTFMLLDNKVVATDTTGGALIYDPDRQAVRSLPSHENLKKYVVSQALGNKLYVIDELTNGTGTRAFEALVYTPSFHGKWHWHALPPPPPPPGVQDSAHDPTIIESCAAVAGGSRILVSARGSGGVQSCTHSFDTERLVWRARPFDWVLPFSGCTEYVPELNNKLWFGISSREHGSVFCASDLSWSSESHPPVLHAVLEDTADGAPPEWHLLSAHARHLGSGKFCVARIFSMVTRSWYKGHAGCDVKQFLVLAGVEVTCSNGGKKVSMVQHNLETYLLCNDDEFHWVL